MFSCFVIAILIMAGFYDDDDDFSLSGLTQEGHDFVTVLLMMKITMDYWIALAS